MDERKNNSEVARVLEQIRREYEAAHHLMYDRADRTARHRFIMIRMENLFDRCHERLTGLIGGLREGTNALAEALEQAIDAQHAPVAPAHEDKEAGAEESEEVRP